VAAVTSAEPAVRGETNAEVLLAIVEAKRGGGVAELVELAERARDYARSSKAANTLRSYASDLRHFGAWCEQRGLVAFPAAADTVAFYLTDHGGVLAVSRPRAPAGASRPPRGFAAVLSSLSM
jgi:hypothetical protein